MIPLFGYDIPIYLPFVVLIAVGLIARRVRVVGTLLSVATWALLVTLLIVLVGERGRFDPYLARVADLLQLDDQTVSGSEVRIRMSADGHFWARTTIDGVPRRMLVDSGATVTALSRGTAQAIGARPRPSLFPMILRTANGSIQADRTEIGELRLGAIVARDLAAVTSPAFGDTDIIGMNFLSRLRSWRVEGRTLILVPHHPQPDRPIDPDA